MNHRLDLSECEREKIHQLGFIQSHGCLLALSDEYKVDYVSENTQGFLGRNASELLGRHITDVLSPEEMARFGPALSSLPGTEPKAYSDGTHNIWLHRWDNRLILEWESRLGDEDKLVRRLEQQLPPLFAGLAAARNLYSMAQDVAEGVAGISGYERVMVYSFQEDWSGEVIAEYRGEDAEPYVGLRYPASDIPPQARLLYTLNPLRVVTDVDSMPIPVLAEPGERRLLDLTYSVLRSVSPYHLEYLRNMGVRATLTASLMVRGRLWGLIACHHSRRKAIPACWRKALVEVAREFSTRIEDLENAAEERAAWRTRRYVQVFAEETPTFAKLAESITIGESRFNQLFQADSMAIYAEGLCAKVGKAPSTQWIKGLASRILKQDEDIYFCSEAAALPALEEAAEEANGIAGVLGIIVSRNPAVVAFCFRAEYIHEIHWGGDITEPATQDRKSGKLSPRRSFSVYRQKIEGRSKPWTAVELDRADQLCRQMQSLLPENSASTPAALRTSLSNVLKSIQNTSAAQRSMLDLAADGASLFVQAEPGMTVPRFANRALLDLLQFDSQELEECSSVPAFLERVGLPVDLCERAQITPQQVSFAIGRDRIRYFQVQHKPVFEIDNPDGCRSLSAFSFTDVTRFAQSIDALEVARRQADRASQVKSSFLANMSHEIRTPMNGILGMTEVLMNTSLTAEQKQCMQAIRDSGDALVGLINDILDLSKIEAGRVELEKVPFDLKMIVGEVARLLSPQAAQKKVGLVVDYDQAVPRFFLGDPGRIRQVLINLVGNAIKFTAVGQVTITVQEEECTRSAASLLLCVRDTGIGIPQDRIPLLFQKFQQVDQSTTRKYGGTGLGLAICKELVSLMGGSIKVASTEAEGSAFFFTVTLPLDMSQTSAPSDNAASDSSAVTGATKLPECSNQQISRRTRVLLVEDNVINQRVAIAFLSRANTEFEVAHSGRQAIDMYQRSVYDLILMDCQMPEMDGFEATALIRQLEDDRRRTPIIALTANAMKEDQQRCLTAGMDDYLAKPVSFDRLREMVEKWAGAKVEQTV